MTALDKVTLHGATLDAAQTAPQELMVVTSPLTMIDKALDRGADVAILEKLLQLEERHRDNLARRAFDSAIAAAKAEIPAIRKNKKVDFTSAKGRTNYSHEDFSEIARTVDPILSRHGLNYRFRSAQDGQTVTVTCILSHRDGHREETTLSCGADHSGNKNPSQAIGSAATYLQRYTIKIALGLAASEDDDARGTASQARINADQFQTLQGLLEEAGADEAKMLQWLKAETVEEMTLAQFDTAVSMLRKKIAQKGGAA